MKAVIVGLGSIGCRHARNLYALGVTEIAALRSRKLPPPAEVPLGLVTLTTWDEVREWGPELAVVANPSAMHVESCAQALEAGCHVYLEKPVSGDLAGAEELVQLAAVHERVVAVGCQLRFHCALEAVREWIAGGEIGRPLSVFADVGEHLPDWHPWEDYRESYAARADLGGGVILTMIHELDYLYWVFGGAGRVFATGGHLTPLEIDVEDTALISMECAGGTAVQLRMDYWRKPPARTLNVVGENGQIDWDYYRGEALLRCGGKTVREARVPEGWERNDMFLATMRDFLEAVREGGAPRIPLADGVDVLKIALACRQSLQTGESVRPGPTRGENQ